MSDLAATNCGCGCEDRCDRDRDHGCDNFCGFGHGGSCSFLIWILILLCFCGHDNWGGGCNGCGDNSCILIILLLLFCGNGFGCC